MVSNEIFPFIISQWGRLNIAAVQWMESFKSIYIHCQEVQKG